MNQPSVGRHFKHEKLELQVIRKHLQKNYKTLSLDHQNRCEVCARSADEGSVV
jgi:hypothetical protein